MEPIVIVNFKCYENGTGKKAVEVAKACAEFGAWVSVQSADIFRVSSQTSAKVFAQHVDPIHPGRGTGLVLPESIVQAGAIGTIINHTERQVSFQHIQDSVVRCREVGLKIIICADSIEQAKLLAPLRPDYIAIEIPELIGGDVSVVSARPGIVSDAVKALGSNVLMGAGIKTNADLAQSMAEGAAGVLLASAIVSKTDDPRKALKELYFTTT